MPLPLLALYDLAVAAKSAIENNWPGDATPLPERRFVSNGSIVWDCDQLAISVDQTYGTIGNPAFEATLSQPDGIGYSLRAASITALLLRCTPVETYDAAGEVDTVPSADELETSAQVLLTDSIAMFNVLLQAYEEGELGVCQGLAFDLGVPQGPDGGLGGWAVKVRALML